MHALSAIVAIAATGATAASADSDGADEALDRFLADHDLDSLLAEHLLAQMERLRGDEQTDAAIRLASVYARLLESATSALEQERWEQRSTALLNSVPDADSLELRLGLARASFVRTERVVERHRLRLTDSGEADVAVQTFEDLGRTFADIATRAGRDVEHFERQEESGRGYDEELLTLALGDARRHRSLGRYFAGWSYYHAAAISGREQLAIAAMRQFGWLLNAEPGELPSLERMPDQFMRYEHVARAAIAVAGCLSLRDAVEDAIAWLHSIEMAEELAPAVHDQLRLFRIEIYARAGRWYDLSQLLDDLREVSGEDLVPLPTLDARLLAVNVFEAEPRTEARAVVESLRETALADLVSRGELGHVLDLARRYGTASLATSGFIVQHVRGLLSYEEARKCHRSLDTDENEPVEDVECAQLYLSAAEALRNATRASDYGRYAGAHGNNMMLLALALYYSSADSNSTADQLYEAAGHFVRASELVDEPSRAANAVWMGIRCLDLLTDRGAGSEAYAARRNELIEVFLDRYPANDRAAALVLKQATSRPDVSEGSLQDLLSIPPESAVYETARRHAARILYDMFRAAPTQDRDWAARRYIEVAEPLLVTDHRRAQAGDAEATSLAVIRARRLLDAMLSVTSPELDRAERTLDVLLSLMAGGMLDDPTVRAESQYRRAQILLARGDIDGARNSVDAIQGRDERFATAGNRLIYTHAAAAWQRERNEALARAVHLYGLRLIAHFAKERPDPLEDSAVVTLHATVANATSWLWRNTGDESARELATRLYGTLLARFPRNAPFLRNGALHAESVRDDRRAVELWRTLASGLEEGSDGWFEARTQLVAALARVEPERARQVLRQHRVLHPDYGPEPWGDRLRSLDRQLGPGEGDTDGETDA